jgi:predicted SpoU family rRNA methylase
LIVKDPNNSMHALSKNADIKFSAYVVFLANSSSGTIKIKRMEIQRNKNTFWEEVGMSKDLSMYGISIKNVDS